MSLIIDESETFEVRIGYKTEEGKDVFSILRAEEVAVAETGLETFTFRKPNWSDSRKMLSSAIYIDSVGGAKLDPYKFMDARLRVLIKNWSLKDKKGERLSLTEENIDRMSLGLVSCLSRALDEKVPLGSMAT